MNRAKASASPEKTPKMWWGGETTGLSCGGASEGCDIEAVSKACWGGDRHP